MPSIAKAQNPKMSITKEIKIRWTGTRPLLICNGELGNPLNASTIKIKQFSTKGRKSEEEYRELAKMQFIAALYYDPKIGPYLPVPNIYKALIQGAAKNKKGTMFKSSLLVEGMVGKERDKAAAKIVYDGPTDPVAMYGDGKTKFVNQCMGKLNGKTSILITRPIFPSWVVEFVAIFEEDTINSVDVETASSAAGRLVAVGTWRPYYGQFKSEILK
jgi:hypothetical protein